MLLTDINKQTLFTSVGYEWVTNNNKKINREVLSEFKTINVKFWIFMMEN